MKAFTAALESMGKKPFSIGSIPPTPELVRQYFDDSTGIGVGANLMPEGPGTREPTSSLSKHQLSRSLHLSKKARAPTAMAQAQPPDQRSSQNKPHVESLNE